MVKLNLTKLQFQSVYNVLSFILVTMMATTLFLFRRVSAVRSKHLSAVTVLISGLVTVFAF